MSLMMIRCRHIVITILFLCYFADTFGQQVRVRVACIGNSVTYGYGLQDTGGATYPVHLRPMPGVGYQVGNFEHSGATLLCKKSKSCVTHGSVSQGQSSERTGCSRSYLL